jgi:hypothetical protein
MDGKHTDGQYSEGRLTNWSRGSSWRPGPQQHALASLEEVAVFILPSQSSMSDILLQMLSFTIRLYKKLPSPPTHMQKKLHTTNSHANTSLAYQPAGLPVISLEICCYITQSYVADISRRSLRRSSILFYFILFVPLTGCLRQK